MSRNLLTSYEVDYGKLRGDAKAQKALDDIKNYIGEGKFRENTKLLQSELVMNFGKFAFLCELQGVRGYPVRAWWDHCFPDRAGEYETWEAEVIERSRREQLEEFR